MRITFLLESAYELFGSVQATLTTASALAARGHVVDVVSVFRTRTTPHHTFDPALPVLSLVDLRRTSRRGAPAPKPPPTPREGELLETPSAIIPRGQPIRAPYSRLTDRNVADHLASSPTDILISAWPALHYHLAELAPRSTVTVAHDHLLYDYHPPAVRTPLREAYGKLDCVVAVAAGAARTYRNRFPELGEKIHHIPNAVRPLPLPPSTLDSKLIIAAGRLVREKRFDLLVEAIGRVVPRHPDWRLRIYGDGPERSRLRALVHELRLHDHVYLMGRVSPMEPEWVKGSIGALTSGAESFGLVILEAMRAGLPVVSTDCPVGPAELIDHGVDGLLVRSGEVEEIAAAISRLIESPARRRRMATKALEKADRFSAGRIAALHEELYSSFLHGKSRIRASRSSRGAPAPGSSASLPHEHFSRERELSVSCTSRSTTELDLVVEGAGVDDELSLTNTRTLETLRIARSGPGGHTVRFPIVLGDLPSLTTGTWRPTVGNRVPRLKLIDDRRLVTELHRPSGGAEALLPVSDRGVLKVHAMTAPSRAQLTDIGWAGELLSIAGVVLGDPWGGMDLQIDTAAEGSKRFSVACAGGARGFRCEVDVTSAWATLSDGTWRVWLADAAEPRRRLRIGRAVSDLRNPSKAMILPSATLIRPDDDPLQICPRYSRTGLLTLEVRRADVRSSPETVPEPAKADAPGRR